MERVADICCICGCSHFNTRGDLCRSCQRALMSQYMQDCSQHVLQLPPELFDVCKAHRSGESPTL